MSYSFYHFVSNDSKVENTKLISVYKLSSQYSECINIIVINFHIYFVKIRIILKRFVVHSKMERKRWSDNLRNFLINATTKDDDQTKKVRYNTYGFFSRNF